MIIITQITNSYNILTGRRARARLTTKCAAPGALYRNRTVRREGKPKPRGPPAVPRGPGPSEPTAQSPGCTVLCRVATAESAFKTQLSLVVVAVQSQPSMIQYQR